MNTLHRRDFLTLAAAGTGALMTGSLSACSSKAVPAAKPLFEISLAQWSLHRAHRANKMTNLDFPGVAKKRFGISAVEYVNSFFKDKAKDEAYLRELKRRCNDHGVRSLLIMVDGEGMTGHPDDAERAKAIENHHRWVDAAAALGCHSIRVNARSQGERDEQMKLAAEGLAKLTAYADKQKINVIVENHGGWSSQGTWLAGVMKMVDHPRCGTLPDFGNFRVGIGDIDWYDRYKGVEELMPFAKAVSAKTHAFDEDGNETATDYDKMMRIVLDAKYRGFVGIEYEGSEHTEDEGIRLTKKLLERVRDDLTPVYNKAN